MKIAAGQAERFAQAPDPQVRAVLVYGPDSGLVRERADSLARSVVEDLSDPFRVAELTARQLLDDPARLADEAAALAMTGGRRVLRIADAGEELAKPLAAFLADPPGEALVVLQAGDLPGRSNLRKTFEAAKIGAALPCYLDDQRSLGAVISETLATAGQQIDPDALAFLSANLGSDRQQTRRELEKLLLYKGEAPGPITLEAALACVGDSALLTLEDLALAVAAGDRKGTERGLGRCQEEGQAPVAVIRAVARHFQRLHFAAGLIAQGRQPADAVKQLRPPVFWKQADQVRRQSQVWRLPQLTLALEKLVEAEAACKATGAPDRLLSARTLLELASNAPRSGGRRNAG